MAISNKVVYIFSVLIILGGLSISFLQYSRNAIDGDIVPIVLPMESYDIVLHDPIGYQAVTENIQYSGAGRYFIHLTLNFVFHQGFGAVNKFIKNPIVSLYLTSALFQLFCHIFLLLMISLYSNITRKFSISNFIGTCAVGIFFFEFVNCCYNSTLIDPAVTYSAFYPFPFAALLLFFYPLLRQVFYKGYSENYPIIKNIFLLSWGATLVFSGPLIPVLGIMIALITILLFLLRNNNFSDLLKLKDSVQNFFSQPFAIKIIFPIFILLWLYDFYLGRYNSENATDVTIIKRYELMFSSIHLYFLKDGLPFYLILVAINFFFIHKYSKNVFKEINFKHLMIIGAATAIYILLLPLGGYRTYRPNILRYDITMPLTVYLIIVIQSGILILIAQLKSWPRMTYIVIVTAILITFWSKNFPIHNSRSEQQEMLTTLSEAKTDSVICLPYSSYFFAWEKIDKPEKSYYVRQMLYNWGITSRQVVFYQK